MLDIVELEAFRKVHRVSNQLRIAFRRRDVDGFFDLLKKAEEASSFLSDEDYFLLTASQLLMLSQLKVKS